MAAGETLALKELLYPCALTWLCTFFDFCECLSCTVLAPATLGKYTCHKGLSESSATRGSGEKGRGGENNAVGFAVINFKCAAHLFSSGSKGNQGSLQGFSYHICVFPEVGMERRLSFRLWVRPVWQRGTQHKPVLQLLCCPGLRERRDGRAGASLLLTTWGG